VLVAQLIADCSCLLLVGCWLVVGWLVGWLLAGSNSKSGSSCGSVCVCRRSCFFLFVVFYFLVAKVAELCVCVCVLCVLEIMEGYSVTFHCLLYFVFVVFIKVKLSIWNATTCFCLFIFGLEPINSCCS